jgi:hypothetical protein
VLGLGALGGVARGRNPGHTDTLARSVSKPLYPGIDRLVQYLTVPSEDEFFSRLLRFSVKLVDVRQQAQFKAQYGKPCRRL